MTIARSTGAFLGTSETSGVAINADSAPAAQGGEKDILGDNTSTGTVHLYVAFTPTAVPSRGSIRLDFQRGRVTGKDYPALSWTLGVEGLTATQQLRYIGSFPAPRYGLVNFKNESDVGMTGVAVLYELEKVS